MKRERAQIGETVSCRRNDVDARNEARRREQIAVGKKLVESMAITSRAATCNSANALARRHGSSPEPSLELRRARPSPTRRALPRPPRSPAPPWPRPPPPRSGRPPAPSFASPRVAGGRARSLAATLAQVAGRRARESSPAPTAARSLGTVPNASTRPSARAQLAASARLRRRRSSATPSCRAGRPARPPAAPRAPRPEARALRRGSPRAPPRRCLPLLGLAGQAASSPSSAAPSPSPAAARARTARAAATALARAAVAAPSALACAAETARARPCSLTPAAPGLLARAGRVLASTRTGGGRDKEGRKQWSIY